MSDETISFREETVSSENETVISGETRDASWEESISSADDWIVS